MLSKKLLVLVVLVVLAVVSPQASFANDVLGSGSVLPIHSPMPPVAPAAESSLVFGELSEPFDVRLTKTSSFRTGPTDKSTVLQSVWKGETVTVLAVNGVWLEVKYKSAVYGRPVKGFIYSKHFLAKDVAKAEGRVSKSKDVIKLFPKNLPDTKTISPAANSKPASPTKIGMVPQEDSQAVELQKLKQSLAAAEERFTKAAEERLTKAEAQVSILTEQTIVAKQQAATAERQLADAERFTKAAEERFTKAEAQVSILTEQTIMAKQQTATAERQLADAERFTKAAEERFIKAEAQVPILTEQTIVAKQQAATAERQLADAERKLSDPIIRERELALQENPDIMQAAGVSNWSEANFTDFGEVQIKQIDDNKTLIKLPSAKAAEAVKLMSTALQSLFRCGGKESVCLSLDSTFLTKPK